MRLGTFLAAAAICFAIGPTAADAQTKKTDVVRLSYPSGWEALPAIVGIERKLFAKEGLVISGLRAENSIATSGSLVGGSSDFALVPQRTLLTLAAAKQPFHIVGMNGWGAEMELVVPAKDKTTKSIMDLKGKRLAVGRGSEALPALMRLLNQKKLTLTDIKVLQMPGVRAIRSLRAGQADAVFEMRALTSAMVQSGQARTVMSNKQITDTIGRIGAAPLLVNARFAKEYPDTVQRFMNAWVRALAHIRGDPEDAAQLLVIYFHRQGTKFPVKTAQSWVNMVRYNRVAWTKQDVADAEYSGWGLVAGKVLKVQPKLDGYVRNEFAEKALESLRASVRKKN